MAESRLEREVLRARFASTYSVLKYITLGAPMRAKSASTWAMAPGRDASKLDWVVEVDGHQFRDREGVWALAVKLLDTVKKEWCYNYKARQHWELFEHLYIRDDRAATREELCRQTGIRPSTMHGIEREIIERLDRKFSAAGLIITEVEPPSERKDSEEATPPRPVRTRRPKEDHPWRRSQGPRRGAKDGG